MGFTEQEESNTFVFSGRVTSAPFCGTCPPQVSAKNLSVQSLPRCVDPFYKTKEHGTCWMNGSVQGCLSGVDVIERSVRRGVAGLGGSTLVFEQL